MRPGMLLRLANKQVSKLNEKLNYIQQAGPLIRKVNAERTGKVIFITPQVWYATAAMYAH